MGKLYERKDLSGQRTLRPLLAITLAASLAAFGCTTNYNPGNGTPTRSGPEVRTAPTSGVTSGSETATPAVNPPMTSSYTRSEAMPVVTARMAPPRGTERVIRRSPDEAAAIMAGRQQLTGRYLGVVSPGLTNQQYVSANLQTGAFQNPALVTNPQLTINSSISSPPLPAISSGAGEVPGGGVVTTDGTTAAATFAGTGTSLTGIGTLPTVASSRIPGVTAASVGTGRATVTGTTATSVIGTTAPATVTGTTFASGSVIGSASGNVRAVRGANGAVTVTNSSSAAPRATPTTASGRNQ